MACSNRIDAHLLLAGAALSLLVACAPRTARTPRAYGGSSSSAADDPYLWLEEITGERALAWVKDQNARTLDALTKTPRFEALRARLRAVLDSDERLAWPKTFGRYAYNFRKDAQHPRGVWRRTTLEDYRTPKPTWETVLDLDALAVAERESWVWQDPRCLYPRYERCLLSLSRGGADAHVVREFDTKSKTFVVGGFTLPEARASCSNPRVSSGSRCRRMPIGKRGRTSSS